VIGAIANGFNRLLKLAGYLLPTHCACFMSAMERY
jgi:hypothetical protein